MQARAASDVEKAASGDLVGGDQPQQAALCLGNHLSVDGARKGGPVLSELEVALDRLQVLGWHFSIPRWRSA
jgi:hypothetical protein